MQQVSWDRVIEESLFADRDVEFAEKPIRTVYRGPILTVRRQRIAEVTFISITPQWSARQHLGGWVMELPYEIIFPDNDKFNLLYDLQDGTYRMELDIGTVILHPVGELLSLDHIAARVA
jgi:hypothetical protein